MVCQLAAASFLPLPTFLSLAFISLGEGGFNSGGQALLFISFSYGSFWILG
jgi:hypothetical protein